MYDAASDPVSSACSVFAILARHPWERGRHKGEERGCFLNPVSPVLVPVPAPEYYSATRSEGTDQRVVRGVKEERGEGDGRGRRRGEGEEWGGGRGVGEFPLSETSVLPGPVTGSVCQSTSCQKDGSAVSIALVGRILMRTVDNPDLSSIILPVMMPPF